MSEQTSFKSSQTFIELLDDENYDISIEVGNEPNVKIFRSHMNVLSCRSPYLRRVLGSIEKNHNDVLAHFKLPSISPEIFQILLK